MRMWLVVLGAIVLIPPTIVTAMIAFGTSAAPQPMASVSAPFRGDGFSDVPLPIQIAARDGTPLSVHVYNAALAPGEPERVAIAIHGATAMGASMNKLAKALCEAGVTVYAPDIRGHGQSGRRGDINYATQLDDDLADLVAVVRTRHPKAKLILMGLSAGGGYALHAVATPLGSRFDRAVLLSPMLGPRAPTARGNLGNAWAQPYLPRIVGLVILGRLGIHALDRLPAIAFGVAQKDAARLTGVYSFRLLGAFGTHDYATDLRNAKCPIAVLVGAADEVFVAERFAPTVHAERAEVPVTVLPGIGHIAMITDARGFPAIVAAVKAPRT
jgi:non-heme chloroperoxidase